MLTPSCDLLPSTSFSSLTIDSAYQQKHLLPLDSDMSDVEALTLADFGFPDEKSVQQAEDAWFVGRQAEEMKPAAREVNARLRVEKFAAGSGYGYTAFRAANPSPDGKKKKGRPVGWRKAMHMKPKTEVLDVARANPASPIKPPKTKSEERAQVKIESAPTSAPHATLSPNSDIQKADAKCSHPSPTPASTGYAAFRAANPGAKKLGRPVGWKMGAHAKRKRIEKDGRREKGGKKPASPEDFPKILASIEMKGEQEAYPFDQQDGEISMQLDQQQDGEVPSLQLLSPSYDNSDEKQEFMELDEDSELPASFWEGVLAAANAPTPTTDLTSSKDIIDAEPCTKPDDQGVRRDSAFDSISFPTPSAVNLDQDCADEISHEHESGSSDMSHFSA